MNTSPSFSSAMPRAPFIPDPPHGDASDFREIAVSASLPDKNGWAVLRTSLSGSSFTITRPYRSKLVARLHAKNPLDDDPFRPVVSVVDFDATMRAAGRLSAIIEPTAEDLAALAARRAAPQAETDETGD